MMERQSFGGGKMKNQDLEVAPLLLDRIF
jgi:hypothetical protein